MTQQLEDVLSELRTKESELVLSARYGKALLEEKEQLRNDLQTAREEMKQLEEVSWEEKSSLQLNSYRSK